MAKNEPIKYSTNNQKARTLGAETGKTSAVSALKSKNKMSSAQGPYQILNGTWKELEKSAGRSLDRGSVKDNDLAFELYTKKSEKALAQNGIEVNPGNTYALHVFGQSGGVDYLKRMKSNPDGLATQGMSSAVINGNKPFFYDESGKPRTNADSYKKVSSRVGGPDDPGAMTLKKNAQKEQQAAQQHQYQYQQQAQEQQQPQQEEVPAEEVPQEQQQQEQPEQEQQAPQSELSKASNAAGLIYSGGPGGNFVLPKQAPIVDGVKTSGEASMKAKTFSYGGSAFSSKTHPSQSMFADGGEINDGLLNDFNSGGTHEENPNGGISQGVDQEGTENTVEEGETRMGDYIFSNRLKLDKADVDNLYLPKETIGMTFADASKFINEFLEENPFDIIIKRTAESQLDSLKIGNDRAKSFKSQEEGIVAESNAPKYQFSRGQEGQEPQTEEQSEQSLSPEDQAIAEQQESGQPQMAYGGYTYGGKNKYKDGGNPLFSGGTITSGLGAISTVAEMGASAFKKYDTNNLDNVIQKQNTGGAIAGGALKGASAGAALGPWGAAAGAVVGAGLGWIGAGSANRAANKQDININEANFNKQYGDLVPDVDINMPQRQAWGAYGGRINKFDGGGDFLKNFSKYELESGYSYKAPEASPLNKPTTNKFTPEAFKYEVKDKETTNASNDKAIYSFKSSANNAYYAGKADKKAAYDKEHPYTPPTAPFKVKGDSPLKYVGAAGALDNYFKAKNEKARVVRSEEYSKTSTPNYFDESIIDNKMSQEMNNRSQAVLATSGGSAAAARAMQYANSSEINKLKSDSYSKMYEINNNVRDKDQAEIQRISDANTGVRNQDYQYNLEEQDHVQERKERARDNLYSSVEAIGQEESDRNLAYNLSGGYKGGRYDPEDVKGIYNMIGGLYRNRLSKKSNGGVLNYVLNHENAQEEKRNRITEVNRRYNG